MRVFVESNFVLELVLEQEHHQACAEFVVLAERSELVLALPVFALFEPFTTLDRRERDRRALHDSLQKELHQVGRTQALANDAAIASSVAALLVRSTNAAAVQFESVLDRLLRVARVVPATGKTFEGARRAQATFGLKLPDAIVLASVLDDLDASPSPSCFLNRNTKDFDDPAIVSALDACGCKLLGSFEAGLQYAKAQMRAG